MVSTRPARVRSVIKYQICVLFCIFSKRMWSNIYYLAFLSLVIFQTECNNKYCSSNMCNNTKQHTLCKFQVSRYVVELI